MAKILTCPNCGNNKNLESNNNTTICSSCGYSWISVSNRNIKSSEIKVVMDSINHYKYTLDQSSNNENTFPFYAIDNNFIEAKGSNRNRLIKVNPIDEQSARESYVGINKFKKTHKHPVIRYGENVDLSMYQDRPTPTPRNPQRIVSDRTNQEYELSRINNESNDNRKNHNNERNSNNERDYNQRIPREHSYNNINNDNQSAENQSILENRMQFNNYNKINNRENNLQERPQLSQRNPNSFSRDTEYINQREEVTKREPNNEQIKKPSLKDRINELSALNEYAEKDPERFFREFEVTKVHEDGSVEIQPRGDIISRENIFREPSFQQNNKENIEDKNVQYSTVQDIPVNSDSFEENNDCVRPETTSIRVRKERLSEEQKEQKAHKEHKIREQVEQEHSPLTYEQYQEKRTQNVLEAQEQQKVRSERIKNKEYTPKATTTKYQRGEKKYYRKNENYSAENGLEQNRPKKYYREKYLNKDDFISDNLNMDTLINHNMSKKFRTDIDNLTKKSSPPSIMKVYEKKERNVKSKIESKPLSDYNPEMLDAMINSSTEIDEGTLNGNLTKNLFVKNPRLSFFENLKVNSDGTLKEDPIGLNQDYNEFFNKNHLAIDEKKYKLKEIIDEIKKRINQDKMSFNLVILIIIFGFFGMLSDFITTSNKEKDNKIASELDIRKDLVKQIPTIDDTSKAKGALGSSDVLVISKGAITPDGKNFINTTSQQDKHDILIQSKKSVASDLSLEELKNNKLADLDANQTYSNKNTTSFMNKTMMYFRQKTNNLFSDVNVVIVSNKWKIDSSGKYFEINVNINNKSTNRSYVIKALEITILDVSGNIISTREIYPNKTLRIKETTSSSIRIPKAPDLSASAYVKILEIS